MKWMLILALAASCTTAKQKDAPPVIESTESDAIQVSPYTVKPCYCMKIFQPVCAEGMNYGNSCEAECQGHTKWTDGECGQVPKK